ncbi:DUF5906 domain-containing protein [Sedimenticola hydrogenitrophicus]|uniref:DUF5906 domain-containing protein n=1 Tax=Sedimenticola hydrogenitrophicus TaxID=2967975 RepID=UPI0023AF5870|nr:DUF5906 domain-containing protein [Sedimenticola hydrogenitrophicus]
MNNPLTFTLFPNLSGSTATEYATSMGGMAEWIRGLPVYPNKDACPLISMNRYGERRTAKNSLRHDANILEATGAIGDYDAGEMAPTTAATLLQMMDIEAVIVTTPSHGIKGNRWRVIAPFAQAHTIPERHELLGKLNTVLGGVLAGESFTASQAFYVGRVAGVAYEVIHVPGTRLDVLPGVEQLEFTGPPAAQPRIGPSDPLALLPKRASGGIDQVRAALRLIDNNGPDWERWNRIGMAVYNATGGSDEGLEAWREWSDRLPYTGKTDDTVDARWSHYRSSPPTNIGMGTLIQMAGGMDAVRPVQTQLEAERRAAQVTENARIGEEVDELPIPTVMTLEEMRRELVYIEDNGGVVHSVTGRVRKKDAAAGTFAASKHRRTTDAGKEKEGSALKIWMESPDRVSVDVLAWVPGEPQICKPPEVVNGNTRAFNIWRGLRPLAAPENWPEWAAPFEQHIAYLVPVEAERRRLIQWLAHIVQHPAELPHTCYLMITEQTGIGRNLLGSVMVRVLRGYVAAGISLGPILDNKFNGRLSQKLLAVVDETREGLGENRHLRGERLKSLITEEHRHIDTKYGLQTVEKNCCRWLMFSNHYDALPFENNDRRVIVIENPTQRQNPEYYAWLYDLVDQPHFIGSVRRYLEQVDLSDFNPGEHAPMSDAKRRALGSMMSETDKAVMEFKETWPGDVAGRSNIRHFVGMAIGNEAHLTKAIERAGMVNAGKRISLSMGMKDSVVIVNPAALSPDQVKTSSPKAIADQIAKAASEFLQQQEA